MDLTDDGRSLIADLGVGVKFVVTHIAYGSSGFNLGTPALPLALVPSASALTAEVFRKEVPAVNNVVETIETPRGKETTYTTVGGDEFTSILGEAALIATVTDPGGSGYIIGDEVFLAQAHFGRIVFSVFDRLAIKWPIQYGP
jgi:hypothetical protein